MVKIALILTVLASSGVEPSCYESSSVLARRGPIDELVFGRLEQLGIPPASLCSDAVFVRRAYLDVVGTLPTAQEARAFLADRDPNKRSVLVDHLLEREEFADYWAMKWGDLLRVKSEFPINLWPNAVQGYHRWIRTCIKENTPYDRFVREMLTASGSNFRVPQVNFCRAVQSKEPQALAQAVALTFMGIRPDGLSNQQWSDMAVFFSHLGYKSTGEWKEEIVYFDPNEKNPKSDTTGVLPDGTRVTLSAGRDPREAFAGWLTAPGNPWFARNIVNRIWSWLLGRGIVHEPDDIRPDNPPSSPELLAFLEKELVAARFDLKHIYRLILNSRTYQLCSIPRSDKPEGTANFASYPLRRLEAEVLIDALNQITGTTEKYSSAIPEPFTFIPEDQRSISLADGSITSSFLEMFGRPPRDTGLESERSNRATADQRLHMLNSSHIQRKIEQGPRLQSLMQSRRKPQQVVDELYLTILSRFPTGEERKIVAAYGQTGGARPREVAIDLAWALINSEEFLYRH
ncbi:MAG: DUF1553 domain-containing protein [Sedimentisphaerales bacterium]|nr:DUF1553 domain-containing protein [Sedimentisphaerales bacterium]